MYPFLRRFLPHLPSVILTGMAYGLLLVMIFALWTNNGGEFRYLNV